MSKPDWKDAPEWANWLAQDADGEWNWFQFEPVRAFNHWQSHGIEMLAGTDSHNWLYTKTLERRP